MKVKELIELLKEQPQDADVLIDCRSTDDIEINNAGGWYYHDKSEIVVHITT